MRSRNAALGRETFHDGEAAVPDADIPVGKRQFPKAERMAEGPLGWRSVLLKSQQDMFLPPI